VLVPVSIPRLIEGTGALRSVSELRATGSVNDDDLVLTLLEAA
jgi:hypothetical protein